MGGVIANDLQKEGYAFTSRLEAALPMTVWAVDLEIERQRVVSAAELAVLRLVDAGVSDTGALAHLMGMRTDGRLSERALVKLLGAGAIEVQGDGFAVTDTGRKWTAEGSALARERVTIDVRHDPVRDAFEWVDHERQAFATADTWTIDLPAVADDMLLRRKAELAKLVREERLPDDEEKSPGERRPAIDLRGFVIVSSRIHWRDVRLDVWKHPRRGEEQIVGHIGDAEHPPLTRLLARYALHEARRRVTRR
jgi:hypothetical protein